MDMTQEEKDRMLFNMKQLLLFLSGYAMEVSKVSFKYKELPVISNTGTLIRLGKLARMEVASKAKIIDMDFIIENIEKIPNKI